METNLILRAIGAIILGVMIGINFNSVFAAGFATTALYWLTLPV